MKKQFLTLALAACLAGVGATCMAQGRPPFGGKGPGFGFDMEQLATELSLDSVQQERLKAVFDEMRPTAQEQGSRPSRRKMRENMEKMRQEMEQKRAEMDKKIKEILTDEQYRKFQELQAKNRPPEMQRPPMREDDGFGGGGDPWGDEDF